MMLYPIGIVLRIPVDNRPFMQATPRDAVEYSTDFSVGKVIIDDWRYAGIRPFTVDRPVSINFYGIVSRFS